MKRGTGYEWFDECWGTALILLLLFPLVVAYIAGRYGIEAAQKRGAS